jgi:hypothetical protein
MWFLIMLSSLCACRLDRGGKGFLQASDWGQADVKQIVQLFTQMYMQRFMGVPGPTSTAEQVECWLFWVCGGGEGGGC